MMEALSSDGASVLGVDEHRCDPDRRHRVKIVGLGVVTIRRNGVSMEIDRRDQSIDVSQTKSLQQSNGQRASSGACRHR